MLEDSDQSAEQIDVIDLPARTVIAHVADPGHNSGGGVIVGLTLAGAAASAELVLRLAARRKSLASRRDEVETLLDAVESHRASFEGAAERDIAAFTRLVDTQREAKRKREQHPEAAKMELQRAYVHAAQAPLSLAREALDFIKEVEQAVELASRFTISDLGAAAALARGAIDAAVLTIDANLAYVDDAQADPLRHEAAMIRANAGKIADRVVELATDVISGRRKGS